MTALEDVLAEHAQVSGFDELGVWHKYGCACSWTGASSTDHRAHVAAAVTAWITERLQGEDVREFVAREWTRVEQAGDIWDELHPADREHRLNAAGSVLAAVPEVLRGES